MDQHVPKNRVLNVKVEHVYTYFMSPTKVVIEQLNDEPFPVLHRIRPKKKENSSSSKKLDMNVPLKESSNHTHIKDGVCDFSMSLVPSEPSQLTECNMPDKQDVVNEFVDASYVPAQREILDDFEPFSDSGYHNVGEYKEEIEKEEEQVQEEEHGHEEDSQEKEEKDNSDYTVDPKVIVDDWEVDMREFNSCVDECKGVVPDSTDGEPSTIIKVTSKKKKISRSTKEEPWLVKTIIDEHLCLQNRNVDSNPRILVSALHRELQMNMELNMCKMKVFKAKSIEKDQLYGYYEKQYSLLRGYCLKLQTNNPRTTVKIEVIKAEAVVCAMPSTRALPSTSGST
uniref:Uncharacterized protein n=1 Tax=Lactuca sativa TaxID=4236 RepID=A0A9R1XN71_LACSA|nr:hypothetical protein LSAT_V11C300107340 [Lactuca sativa]